MAPVLPSRRGRAAAAAAAVLGAALAGGGLVHLVHVGPAPRPIAPPADRVPADRPLAAARSPVPPPVAAAGPDADDDGRCLAFLGDWGRQPGEVLTLRRGWDGCPGSFLRDTLTVDAAGRAVWSRSGHADRLIPLTPAMRDRLRAVAGLSCVATNPTAMDVLWTEVQRGSAGGPARQVVESEAHDHLEEIFADLAAAHVARRLAAHPHVRVRVTIAPGSRGSWPSQPVAVTVAPRGLTIRARGRTLRAPALAPELLADVMDWHELAAGEAPPGRPAAARPAPEALVEVAHHALVAAGVEP